MAQTTPKTRTSRDREGWVIPIFVKQEIGHVARGDIHEDPFNVAAFKMVEGHWASHGNPSEYEWTMPDGPMVKVSYGDAPFADGSF